jgi:pimeloyl-ACP methyl ester carboxylesterase
VPRRLTGGRWYLGQLYPARTGATIDEMERDAFAARFEVPVAGGQLHVARAGSPPDAADTVVLAAHGVTASLMTFGTVARLLPEGVSMLAPDLRGRGRSASLPGPYGMGAHVADLLAVLNRVDVPSAVLMGHSMGAYVAARIAAENPERVAGLLLLDAGLPFPLPEDPTQMLDSAVASAVMRLGITFPSADEYVQGWRVHPAFAEAWDEDVEAYARYDLVENGHGVRCAASAKAVRTDSREMLVDDSTRTALDRVDTSVELLRAERGLFDDDDNPLISVDDLHEFAAEHQELHFEEVAGVNHYTLVMGRSPGPARVVAAIERMRPT